MEQYNIETIYQIYANQVYKYLFCLTHNVTLSEDLTQETFYIAVKEIRHFRQDCKLFVWLCQIAKNLYYRELKKHKKISIIPFEDINESGIQQHNIENVTINKLDIYSKINRLDEKTREIMSLRLIGDLTFKQISEILRISENSARVIFYRGKQKLKEVDDNGEK